MLAMGGAGRDAAAEHEAAEHKAVVAHGVALDVLDDDALAAMDRARVEQALEQGLAPVGSLEHHVGHDVIELGADDLAPGGALDLIVELDPSPAA